jgi:hypothetical protein
VAHVEARDLEPETPAATGGNEEGLMKVQTQHITAEFAAAAANRDSRSVPMTVYTGASVLQFNWQNGLHSLTLSMDPANVRLGKLNSGRAPFTNGHADANDPGATIGVISNARIEGGQVKADVRFSKRPDVEPIYNDVLDGILPNVSVGASLHKLKETTKEGDSMKSFLATDWEPFAVALVGLGADPGAHLGAAAHVVETDCEVEFNQAFEENIMATTTNNGAVTVTLTEQEQENIRKRVALANLPAALAQDLIAKNAGTTEVADAIFSRLAAKCEETPTLGHRTMVDGGNPRDLAGRMSEALACRYSGGTPSDGAREFMGSRISDMAREICSIHGLRAPRSTAGAIEMAMNDTSDFPYLLQQSGERQLLAAYTASQSKLKAVCRRSTFNDFRTKATVRLGEAPKLIKVPENGSITSGTRAESHESYRGYTWARIFAITREALVNDDLGAFADFSRAWGVAASSLEADVLVNLLYGAAGVGPDMADTNALFHAAHGNLAVPGAAISDTTLGAARLALRLMKGVDAATIIEVNPRYLVAPAALETTAEKYLASLYPAQASGVNPFSGKLELIVEPRLDAKSATGWYVFGDPALCPVIEYSYLAGHEGPQVDMRPGWEVLGAEFRCVLDFGAGVIDSKGAYKGN